jgi:hypothetical protein
MLDPIIPSMPGFQFYSSNFLDSGFCRNDGVSGVILAGEDLMLRPCAEEAEKSKNGISP